MYAQLNRLVSVPFNKLHYQALFKIFLCHEAFYKRAVLNALEWESVKHRQRSISATTTVSEALLLYLQHALP